MFPHRSSSYSTQHVPHRHSYLPHTFPCLSHLLPLFSVISFISLSSLYPLILLHFPQSFFPYASLPHPFPFLYCIHLLSSFQHSPLLPFVSSSIAFLLLHFFLLLFAFCCLYSITLKYSHFFLAHSFHPSCLFPHPSATFLISSIHRHSSAPPFCSSSHFLSSFFLSFIHNIFLSSFCISSAFPPLNSGLLRQSFLFVPSYSFILLYIQG